MKKAHSIFIVVLATVGGVFLIGCGGGGGPSGGLGKSVPMKILTWAPPALFTDNSSLNPATDLDVFEVYVKTDGDFSGNDSAIASVSAIDSGTGQVNTTFNLAGLKPYLSDGVTYYVSIRAVANNGLRSDFSQPATFSF